MNASDASGAESNGSCLHDGVGLLGQSLELSRGVDDVARTQCTSMGSLARKRARRRVLGSALRDSMWRRRIEGFLSPRPDKDRNSMSLEWVLPKALMRPAFSAAYLSLVEGDRIKASTSPVVTLSRAAIK